MATQNISTEKIRLRKYKQSDADILHDLLGIDPEITKYTGWNPYATVEQARKTVDDFIRQYSDDHFYGWAIEVDGKFVGTIGAYDYDTKDNSIEIGYSIGIEFWGRGYATEALILACYYLEQYENMERIHAWTKEGNIASVKVLEKAGMKYLGKEGDTLFYEYQSSCDW